MLINLMYHDVVPTGAAQSSGFAGAAADLYKLEHGVFAGHLAAIAQGTGVGVTVFDALQGSNNEAVLLTFDDGGASFMHIADALEQRDWRGHFFITTDYIGRPGFLSNAEISELHGRGHVIGSHSCSHPERISHCSDSELRHEWGDSVARLADVTGGKIATGSVPGGFHSARVAAAAHDAGIEVLFNSEPTVRLIQEQGCTILGRFAMERLDAPAAGQLAGGSYGPRFRQAALWQIKKMAKAVGGRYWFALRKRMIGRS